MNKPQIRIKGFEGEWETTSIEDIANRYDNLRIPVKESYRVKGNIPYYGANGIQDYVDGYTHEGEFILVAEDGANNLEQYPVQYVNGKVWVNNHAHVLQSKESHANNMFLKYAISCTDIKSLLVGGGRSKLNSDTLMKLKLLVPSLTEQQSLASFFRSFDFLIHSTAKKIASLKQIKAASLQSMFPQNGETKPKVRFKGFEEEWKTCKLSDVATFSKGSGYSKNDLCDKGCPIIMYGRMYTKYSFFMDKVDTYVTPKNQSVYSKGNEVILPASGETAEDIACAAAVTSTGTILGGDLNILSFDTDKYNTQFIALYITYGQTHWELAKYAQGKTVVHLHNSDIEKGTVVLPSFEEQQKIASYFRSLDEQISLQEKRLEKLKQIKSTCLDKMFV